jgi:hypothetical protein
MSKSWLDAYTAAAREAASLPADWHGWLFTAVPGQGVLVKGAVCPPITRGPRKGAPNFRKSDRRTERQVFVSNEAAERMRMALVGPPTMEPLSLADIARELGIAVGEAGTP